jgi:hypothetical protein
MTAKSPIGRVRRILISSEATSSFFENEKTNWVETESEGSHGSGLRERGMVRR